MNKNEKKARDLMIGDWVTVKHSHRQPTTEKVYGIGPTQVLIKMDNGMYSFEYESIQPIPITEEFLQKNGFCSKHNDLYYLDSGWYLDIEGHAIGKFNDAYESPQFLKQFTVNYVHELQHLLRIMGEEKEVEV